MSVTLLWQFYQRYTPTALMKEDINFWIWFGKMCLCQVGELIYLTHTRNCAIVEARVQTNFLIQVSWLSFASCETNCVTSTQIIRKTDSWSVIKIRVKAAIMGRLVLWDTYDFFNQTCAVGRLAIGLFLGIAVEPRPLLESRGQRLSFLIRAHRFTRDCSLAGQPHLRKKNLF